MKNNAHSGNLFNNQMHYYEIHIKAENKSLLNDWPQLLICVIKKKSGAAALCNQFPSASAVGTN